MVESASDRGACAHSRERYQTAFDEVVWIVMKEATEKARARPKAVYRQTTTRAVAPATHIFSGTTRLTPIKPFNCTRDKGIYQHWQVWRQQTRHSLKAMEEDSEDVKVNYIQ